MARKFWNFKSKDPCEASPTRELHLVGVIAEESWFDDEVSPAIFKEELFSDTSDITLWINSPGGDCIAAAQIYNMLKSYPGRITAKIDGLAASAASVIAMAADEVLMSPVATMMVHNPITAVMGDASEMCKAQSMLSEIKESIINAYELKTKRSRKEISRLMDVETWMSAKKAVELGFADGVLNEADYQHLTCSASSAANTFAFKRGDLARTLQNKLSDQNKLSHEHTAHTRENADQITQADELMRRISAYERM